ncbi:hypothetical protein SAMN05216343_11484, partial [Oscillibacter sp. PC13]|uniref:hypothetical protein n=1 Tax=Oscillibacter sp. PC13 TaxID=1855299 RepID=UPI0008F3FE50
MKKGRRLKTRLIAIMMALTMMVSIGVTSASAHGNGKGSENGVGHQKYDDPTNITGNGKGKGHSR